MNSLSNSSSASLQARGHSSSIISFSEPAKANIVNNESSIDKLLNVVLLTNDKYTTTNVVYVSKKQFQEFTRDVKYEGKKEELEPLPTYVKIANFIFRLAEDDLMRKNKVGFNPAQYKFIESSINRENKILVSSCRDKPESHKQFEKCVINIRGADSRFQSLTKQYLDKTKVDNMLRQALSREIIRKEHPLYLKLPSGIFQVQIEKCYPLSADGFGYVSKDSVLEYSSESIDLTEVIESYKIKGYVFKLLSKDNRFKLSLTENAARRRINEFMLTKTWIGSNTILEINHGITAIMEAVETFIIPKDPVNCVFEWSRTATINFIWDENKVVIAREKVIEAKKIELKFLRCINVKPHEHERSLVKLIQKMKEVYKWYCQGEVFSLSIEKCIYQVEVLRGDVDDTLKLKIRWQINEKTEIDMQFSSEISLNQKLSEGVIKRDSSLTFSLNSSERKEEEAEEIQEEPLAKVNTNHSNCYRED